MALTSAFSIFDCVQVNTITAVAQELLVLAVFFASFTLWRHLNRRVHTQRQKTSADAVFEQSSHRKLQSPQCSEQIEEEAAKMDKASRVALASKVVSSQASALRQRCATPGPQIRAAEQQMLKLLEGREFTRALKMYRSLEREGKDRNLSDTELFSAFIQSATRVGKVDVVTRMLRTMRRNGVVPNLEFWQCILRMLSSRKLFSACLTVFEVFGTLLPTDKIVFSCLINAALENGCAEDALPMLERYAEADITAKDHVLFFRVYVALGDVDSAEAIFHKLGSETSTLMFNLLLLTCVNAHRSDKLLTLIREAHQLEKDGERIVDSVSYNTGIKGFTQAGQPQKCFDCLHEMREHGLEPDDVTFGTLLDVCIVDNDLGAATEVVDLLMGEGRKMDTVMCTLFIKGLIRANCLTKAMELYDRMKHGVGSHPDVVTYSVLIKAFVDDHNLERAMDLLKDMQEAGLKADDIILTHLLEGCRHTGNHELGKKLFKEMLEEGIRPSEFTLITMVKLHGRCGAHEEAYDLVATWEEKFGLKPSVIHYTCLMSGCIRTRHHDQAWRAYELMRSNGVPADETAFTTLLPGMVAGQYWDHALTLCQAALKGPHAVGIPTEAVNSALGQMQASGMTHHAQQLHQLMVESGVPVRSRKLQAQKT
mmetsp:Transcript_20158/g.36501  ORF Transcript_20158/g.36501 Transcript_20158/m.36501 type:complete len:652 (+) Transcript_20158:130-2085(+)